MIIGGCCLLILLISCSVGGFLWWKTSQAIDSVTGGEGLMGAANRLALNTHFTSFTSVCAADPSGASAAGSFHPSVAPTYQALACQVPAGAAAAVQDATRCPGSGSDEGRAAPLSIDPTTCSTITCGTGKAVVCGGLIVHLENPASFQ